MYSSEMDSGTEISQKIRSAIKAKLLELGAYVDEELPDYIMVMVANKKSQSAMTEDLNLFLGTNTEKFTTWLQTLLTKLQTISTTAKKGKEEKPIKAETQEKPVDKKILKSSQRKSTEKVEKTAASAKVVSKVPKSVTTQKTAISVGKEKGAEKALVTISSATKPQKVGSTAGSQSTQSVERRTSREIVEPVVTVTDSAQVSPTSEFTDTKDGHVDNEQDEGESLVVATAAEEPNETEEPEFTVKAGYDEFSEEFSQEAEREAQAEEAKKAAAKVMTGGSAAHRQPLATESVTEDKSRRSTTVFARISPVQSSTTVSGMAGRVVPLSSRLGNAVHLSSPATLSLAHRRTSSVGEVRRVEQSSGIEDQHVRRTVSTSSAGLAGVKRRMPGSVVSTVSVKSRRVVEEAEEEYDPLNPAVGNVASVVKVTARRSSVPRNMQANKSLLMKAVDEAAKSVGVKKTASVRSVERVQPRSNPLFTRSKREEIMRTLKREVLQDPKSVPVKRQMITRPVKMETHSDEELEEDMVVTERQTLVINQDSIDPELTEVEGMEEGISTDYQDDSRLVHVGYVYRPSQKKPVVERVESGHIIQEKVLPASLELETEREEEEEYEVKTESLPVGEAVITYTPTRLTKSSSQEYTSTNKRLVKEKEGSGDGEENTRFIVTLDGVDPLKFETKDQQVDTDDTVSSNVGSVVPVVHVKPKRQKVETVSISLTGSDAENEEEDEPDQNVRSKLPERCKFWPACANGNQCAYHHPCTPCRSFPNCKFGDKCLYIHPNCKFDANCTKRDCPFTHASKRPAPVKPAVPQYISLPPQAAAFLYPVAATNPVRPGSKTTKQKCKFFPNCTNMNCPFTHPKPCRYGLSCAKKSTCQFHHPALPGKDQLKWSSSGPMSKPEHISDRKFDQGPVKVGVSSKS